MKILNLLFEFPHVLAA